MLSSQSMFMPTHKLVSTVGFRDLTSLIEAVQKNHKLFAAQAVKSTLEVQYINGPEMRTFLSFLRSTLLEVEAKAIEPESEELDELISLFPALWEMLFFVKGLYRLDSRPSSWKRVIEVLRREKTQAIRAKAALLTFMTNSSFSLFDLAPKPVKITSADIGYLFYRGSAGANTMELVKMLQTANQIFETFYDLVRCVKVLHTEEKVKNKHHKELLLASERRRKLNTQLVRHPTPILRTDERATFSDGDLDAMLLAGGCSIEDTLTVLESFADNFRDFPSFSDLLQALEKETKNLELHQEHTLNFLQHQSRHIIDDHTRSSITPRHVKQLFLESGAGTKTPKYLRRFEEDQITFGSMTDLFEALGAAHVKHRKMRNLQIRMMSAYLHGPNRELFFEKTDIPDKDIFELVHAASLDPCENSSLLIIGGLDTGKDRFESMDQLVEAVSTALRGFSRTRKFESTKMAILAGRRREQPTDAGGDAALGAMRIVSHMRMIASSRRHCKNMDMLNEALEESLRKSMTEVGLQRLMLFELLVGPLRDVLESPQMITDAEIDALLQVCGDDNQNSSGVSAFLALDDLHAVGRKYKNISQLLKDVKQNMQARANVRGKIIALLQEGPFLYKGQAREIELRTRGNFQDLLSIDRNPSALLRYLTILQERGLLLKSYQQLLSEIRRLRRIFQSSLEQQKAMVLCHISALTVKFNFLSGTLTPSALRGVHLERILAAANGSVALAMVTLDYICQSGQRYVNITSLLEAVENTNRSASDQIQSVLGFLRAPHCRLLCTKSSSNISQEDADKVWFRGGRSAEVLLYLWVLDTRGDPFDSIDKLILGITMERSRSAQLGFSDAELMVTVFFGRPLQSLLNKQVSLSSKDIQLIMNSFKSPAMLVYCLEQLETLGYSFDRLEDLLEALEKYDKYYYQQTQATLEFFWSSQCALFSNQKEAGSMTLESIRRLYFYAMSGLSTQQHLENLNQQGTTFDTLSQVIEAVYSANIRKVASDRHSPLPTGNTTQNSEDKPKFENVTEIDLRKFLQRQQNNLLDEPIDPMDLSKRILAKHNNPAISLFLLKTLVKTASRFDSAGNLVETVDNLNVQLLKGLNADMKRLSTLSEICGIRVADLHIQLAKLDDVVLSVGAGPFTIVHLINMHHLGVILTSAESIPRAIESRHRECLDRIHSGCDVLVSHMAGPKCFLFANAPSPVRFKDVELQMLLSAGGTVARTLQYLFYMDQSGMRVSSLSELVDSLYQFLEDSCQGLVERHVTTLLQLPAAENVAGAENELAAKHIIDLLRSGDLDVTSCRQLWKIIYSGRKEKNANGLVDLLVHANTKKTDILMPEKEVLVACLSSYSSSLLHSPMRIPFSEVLLDEILAAGIDVAGTLFHMQRLDVQGFEFADLHELANAVSQCVAKANTTKWEILSYVTSPNFHLLDAGEPPVQVQPHHVDEIYEKSGAGEDTLRYMLDLDTLNAKFASVEALVEAVRSACNEHPAQKQGEQWQHQRQLLKLYLSNEGRFLFASGYEQLWQTAQQRQLERLIDAAHTLDATVVYLDTLQRSKQKFETLATLEDAVRGLAHASNENKQKVVDYLSSNGCMLLADKAKSSSIKDYGPLFRSGVCKDSLLETLRVLERDKPAPVFGSIKELAEAAFQLENQMEHSVMNELHMLQSYLGNPYTVLDLFGIEQVKDAVMDWHVKNMYYLRKKFSAFPAASTLLHVERLQTNTGNPFQSCQELMDAVDKLDANTSELQDQVQQFLNDTQNCRLWSNSAIEISQQEATKLFDAGGCGSATLPMLWLMQTCQHVYDNFDSLVEGLVLQKTKVDQDSRAREKLFINTHICGAAFNLFEDPTATQFDEKHVDELLKVAEGQYLRVHCVFSILEHMNIKFQTADQILKKTFSMLNEAKLEIDFVYQNFPKDLLPQSPSRTDVDRLYFQGGAGPSTKKCLRQLWKSGLKYFSIQHLMPSVRQQAFKNLIWDRKSLYFDVRAYIQGPECGFFFENPITHVPDAAIERMLKFGNPLPTLKCLNSVERRFKSFDDLLNAMETAKVTGCHVDPLAKERLQNYFGQADGNLLENVGVSLQDVDTLFIVGGPELQLMEHLNKFKLVGRKFKSVADIASAIEMTQRSKTYVESGTQEQLMQYLLSPSCCLLSADVTQSITGPNFDDIIISGGGTMNSCMSNLVKFDRINRRFQTLTDLTDSLRHAEATGMYITSEDQLRLLDYMKEKKARNVLISNSFDLATLTPKCIMDLAYEGRGIEKTVVHFGLFENIGRRFSGLEDLLASLRSADISECHVSDEDKVAIQGLIGSSKLFSLSKSNTLVEGPALDELVYEGCKFCDGEGLRGAQMILELLDERERHYDTFEDLVAGVKSGDHKRAKEEKEKRKRVRKILSYLQGNTCNFFPDLKETLDHEEDRILRLLEVDSLPKLIGYFDHFGRIDRTFENLDDLIEATQLAIRTGCFLSKTTQKAIQKYLRRNRWNAGEPASVQDIEKMVDTAGSETAALRSLDIMTKLGHDFESVADVIEAMSTAAKSGTHVLPETCEVISASILGPNCNFFEGTRHPDIPFDDLVVLSSEKYVIYMLKKLGHMRVQNGPELAQIMEKAITEDSSPRNQIMKYLFDPNCSLFSEDVLDDPQAIEPSDKDIQSLMDIHDGNIQSLLHSLERFNSCGRCFASFRSLVQESKRAKRSGTHLSDITVETLSHQLTLPTLKIFSGGFQLTGKDIEDCIVAGRGLFNVLETVTKFSAAKRYFEKISEFVNALETAATFSMHIPEKEFKNLEKYLCSNTQFFSAASEGLTPNRPTVARFEIDQMVLRFGGVPQMMSALQEYYALGRRFPTVRALVLEAYSPEEQLNAQIDPPSEEEQVIIQDYCVNTRMLREKQIAQEDVVVFCREAGGVDAALQELKAFHSVGRLFLNFHFLIPALRLSRKTGSYLTAEVQEVVISYLGAPSCSLISPKEKKEVESRASEVDKLFIRCRYPRRPEQVLEALHKLNTARRSFRTFSELVQAVGDATETLHHFSQKDKSALIEVLKATNLLDPPFVLPNCHLDMVLCKPGVSIRDVLSFLLGLNKRRLKFGSWFELALLIENQMKSPDVR